MQEFSLLYPQGVEPDCKTLCEEAVNDLSLELICEKLADDTFEHNIIKNIMIKIERNPAVIRYRTDIIDFNLNKLLYKRTKEVFKTIKIMII